MTIYTYLDLAEHLKEKIMSSENENNENQNIENIDNDTNQNEESVQSDNSTISTVLMDPSTIRPSRILVVPVYGRPFMPGLILPVQVSAKQWKKTFDMVLKSPTKSLALFCIPVDDQQEIQPELKEAELLKKIPQTGCLIRIIHARMNDNEIQFIAEGIARVSIREFVTSETPPFLAEVEYPETTNNANISKQDIKAHALSIVNTIKELLPLNPVYSEEIKQLSLKFTPNNPSDLADCAAAITTATGSELQKVLDTYEIFDRLQLCNELLIKELEVAKLQNNIRNSVEEKVQKRQREYYLHEQMKVIQKELGISVDDKTSDVNKFTEKMSKLNPPTHVKEKFDEEIAKLKVLETGSPEYAVTRNYLDWMVNVPWGIVKEEKLDIENARKVLDEDHDAIPDVKERIVEFVAVGCKKGEVNGSILLFVGPPGVGKTSVGKSIARALNRPFYRFSVGGLRDEAEIKGHRRTYIGAMPGKLVQALKQSKCVNPVIMLDEIDKLTNSNYGDPSAALLEALDPEQNSEFLDHYLDLPVDLSKCLFICTANSTETIPQPLLDRMDTISLTGYLSNEKLAIAKHHLLPKIIKNAGLLRKNIRIPDKVIRKIIEDYAREAGVRHLEKLLAKIVRKAVVKMIDNKTEEIIVSAEDLHEYLKSPLFRADDQLKGVGIATGLAWTSMGGATIPVEAALINKLGPAMKLTGSLGDVMKESAEIAYSFASANIGKFDPKKKTFFDKAKIHLHVPEGATPKDGPSAGITMATALISLGLNKAPAKGYAMTGELTLTGRVLAIGGIREKTLAAKRLGIKKLICPKLNENDVKDLPDFVKDGVEYFFVDTYKDVADILFPSISK